MKMRARYKHACSMRIFGWIMVRGIKVSAINCEQSVVSSTSEEASK